MTHSDIENGHLCRECINRQTGARLRRRDCKYWYFLAQCSQCGEVRNIVTGLTLQGKWKLFWSNLMN